jgi:hypothetical protein
VSGDLAKSFEQGNSYGCREVEAAHAGSIDRDLQHSVAFNQLLRQSSGLGAKDQTVSGQEGEIGIDALGMAGKANPPASGQLRPQRLEAGMDLQGDVGPVVEARPLQVSVAEAKAQGLDQVERRVRGRARSGNVAGILRDLRLEEYHLKRAAHALGPAPVVPDQ